MSDETRLMKYHEAADHIGVHRSTIYTLVRDDPTFPQPVRVRPRCPRLVLCELDRWVQMRKRTDAGFTAVIPAHLANGKARGPQRRAA